MDYGLLKCEGQLHVSSMIQQNPGNTYRRASAVEEESRGNSQSEQENSTLHE